MTTRSLVTGGLGFIGKELCRQLVERGEDVRILDTDQKSNGLPEEVEVIRGSILNRAQLKMALKGVNHLYHLAAIPDLWLKNKKDFHFINTTGTRLVLETAANAGVERIVYTSTESITRGVKRRHGEKVIDETTPMSLKDMPGPYCRSKFLAEQEAISAAKRGVPVVIVNPTLPVGPGDSRLTPPTRMLLGFLNGEYPAYLESHINMIHVSDVAAGHILATDKGRIGERYILGNENLDLSDLLSILEELTGLAMPKRRVPFWLALGASMVDEFVADHFTHKAPNAPLTGVRLAAQPMIFDVSKARNELNLPMTPIRDSLAEAIRWFSEQGLLLRAPLKPRWKANAVNCN